MTEFIREFEEQPVYKITLKGRKSPWIEGFVYPRRGRWTEWEEGPLEIGTKGFHLILDRQELLPQLRIILLTCCFTVDLWEVESDAVAKRSDGVGVAHRFRLKDRVFQVNPSDFLTEGRFDENKLDRILKGKLDEHYK